MKNYNKSSDTDYSFINYAFCYVLVVLFIICVLRFVGSIGAEPLTFTAFLEFLSSFEPVSLGFSIGTVSLSTDWGIFSFLLPLVNVFAQVGNFLLMLMQGLFSLCYFVVRFLAFVLVG